MFALLPMAMLIGRSTRVLGLAAAANDLAMPYRRLAGFFLPWLDGAAPPLVRSGTNPFHGYESTAYFWDTFCYTGWAPWIAAVVLLATTLIAPRVRRHLTKAGVFIAALGVAGIVLSPVHVGLCGGFGKYARFVVPLAMGGHCFDLAGVDRAFIVQFPFDLKAVSDATDETLHDLGDARAAIDYNLPISANRRVDIGLCLICPVLHRT
jgi:hypothetical protein